MLNNSPWLEEIKDRTLPQNSINKNAKTDILIIGGGISGILTAYYLLTLTNKSVRVLDAKHIASGASGHNAGIMVNTFDENIEEFLRTYPIANVVNTYNALENSWELFDEILEAIPQIKQYFKKSQSTLFFESIDHLIEDIKSYILKKDIGILQKREYFISQKNKKEIESSFKSNLPFINFLSDAEIQNSSQVFEHSSVGYKVYKPVGIINSARLCYDIAVFLLLKYNDRFCVNENNQVNFVNVFNGNEIQVETSNDTYTSSQLILCTNAYSAPKCNITFPNVKPVINFMQGTITEKIETEDVVERYIKHDYSVESNDYIYVSRRKWMETKTMHSIGSTFDKILDKIDPAIDEVNLSYDEISHMDRQLKGFYKYYNGHTYSWHGAMGYTDKMLRIVDRHRTNLNVFINIGCNGIGIIPAIYSGRKIAKLVNNETVVEDIFELK